MQGEAKHAALRVVSRPVRAVAQLYVGKTERDLRQWVPARRLRVSDETQCGVYFINPLSSGRIRYERHQRPSGRMEWRKNERRKAVKDSLNTLPCVVTVLFGDITAAQRAQLHHGMPAATLTSVGINTSILIGLF